MAANKSDVLNKWNFFNHAAHAMLYLHVLTVISIKLILHVIVAVQTLKRYTIECCVCSHLQRLRIYDMPAVEDKKLIALLLEEALPAGCIVEGVDFNAPEDKPVAMSNSLPTFLQRYDDLVHGEHRERAAVIEKDRQLAGLDGNTSSTSTKQDVGDKLCEEKKVSC